jgi:hypothetical protein
MKRLAIESCSVSVQELAKLAETEPVILTREGNPILGVVGIDEAEVEAWSLGSIPDFLALMERFRGRGGQEGGLSLAQVRRRRLGIAQGTSGKLDVPEEAKE